MTVYALVGLTFRQGLARLRTSVSEERPFVSVVIAARNEAGYIGHCLDGLARQTYPSDRFEVIVVDDDSSDRTYEEARSRPFVRVIEPDPEFDDYAAKKRPMATGMLQARGSIILTTDADCRIRPEWIASTIKAFTADVDAVVGFSQVKDGQAPLSWIERLQAVDFLSLMTAAAGSAGWKRALAASGQNFAFRKDLYDNVGGYGTIRHRPSGDDVLLLQLFRRAGARVCFCLDPGSFVSTWRTESLAGYLSQRRRWASNAMVQARLNPAFFGYIASVFVTNLGLPFGLIAGIDPTVIASLVCGKFTIDASLVWKGGRLFGRTDLLRSFPLWFLLQPVYIATVGLLGTVFGFTWKERRHAARPSPSDVTHATV